MWRCSRDHLHVTSYTYEGKRVNLNVSNVLHVVTRASFCQRSNPAIECPVEKAELHAYDIAWACESRFFMEGKNLRSIVAVAEFFKGIVSSTAVLYSNLAQYK